MHTRTVPISEYLVNDSPRIKVAKMVLKTSPDCNGSIQVNSRDSSPRKRGTDSLEGGKHGERKGRDLDGTAYDVRANEHPHAHLERSALRDTIWGSRRCVPPYLPSSTLVRRSANVVRVFFVFEDMRLALESQPDGLETGRDQPDKDPNL